MSFECELRDLIESEDPKTVGDLMVMECDGLLNQPLSEKTKIVFPDKKKAYSLHLVKVKETNTEKFVAHVTSYKPDNYVNEKFNLVDGEISIPVENLSWSYDSVLEEARQYQVEVLEIPPDKFGPFPFVGPVGLGYPLWVYLWVAAIFSVFGYFLFRWQRKRMQKRRLIEMALSGMGSALSPYQDFNKSVRGLLRRFGGKSEKAEVLLGDLDQAFRAYLTRALTVPAFDWSQNEIVRDIRKNHQKLYSENGRDIVRLLREFDRAKAASVKVRDVEQLTELSRVTVEHIDRYKNHLKKPKAGLA